MFGITETEKLNNVEAKVVAPAPKKNEIPPISMPQSQNQQNQSGLEYQLSRIADQLEEMNQLTKISKGILKATVVFLDTAAEHPDDMAEMDSAQILGLYATSIKEACGDLLKKGE